MAERRRSTRRVERDACQTHAFMCFSHRDRDPRHKMAAVCVFGVGEIADVEKYTQRFPDLELCAVPVNQPFQVFPKRGDYEDAIKGGNELHEELFLENKQNEQKALEKVRVEDEKMNAMREEIRLSTAADYIPALKVPALKAEPNQDEDAESKSNQDEDAESKSNQDEDAESKSNQDEDAESKSNQDEDAESKSNQEEAAESKSNQDEAAEPNQDEAAEPNQDEAAEPKSNQDETAAAAEPNKDKAQSKQSAFPCPLVGTEEDTLDYVVIEALQPWEDEPGIIVHASFTTYDDAEAYVLNYAQDVMVTNILIVRQFMWYTFSSLNKIGDHRYTPIGHAEHKFLQTVSDVAQKEI